MTIYTWVELFSELIASSVNLPNFRQALPRGFANGSGSRAPLKAELLRRLDELRESADLDRVIEILLGQGPGRTRSARNRIGLHNAGHWAEYCSQGPGISLYSVTNEENGLVLEFQGKTIALPVHVQPSFEICARRGLFRPIELAGHLDEEGKLQLARFLHAENFLTFAD